MDWNRVITEEEEAASAAARAAAAAERGEGGEEGGGEQWYEDEDDEDDEDDGDDLGPSAAKVGRNQCAFVWEGVETRPRFNQFRFEECYTADGARRLLARFGCAAYWDSAKAAAPWRQSGAQLALPPASSAAEASEGGKTETGGGSN